MSCTQIASVSELFSMRRVVTDSSSSTWPLSANGCLRSLFLLAGILGGSLLNVNVTQAAPPISGAVATKAAPMDVHPYYKFPDYKLNPNVQFTSWTFSKLCKAYHFPTKITSANGVIGILELGGGWLQSDLDLFSKMNGLPPITVTNVSVDGTQNNPGSPTNPNGADYEVALDIQAAVAAYYYATGKMPTVKVFFAQNSFNSFVSVINSAVQNKCDVLSISWGAPELIWDPKVAAQVEAAAQTASAAGLAIFAASGDNSSSDGFFGVNVDLPAACPHIIGCGGTSKGSSSEVVWGDGFQYDSGTGGGFSTIFPVQSFQTGAPKAPSGLGRMVPDIAADADPNTGVLIVVYGQEVQIGGTSGVSPLYSGLFAALGKKLGFVTPFLWKNQTAFVDITSGSNGTYSAAKGPDPCTGIGVPNGTAIAALYGFTPPPPSVVTTSFSNGTLTITGDNNDNGVIVTYTPKKVANQIVGGTIAVAAVDSTTTVNGGSTATFTVGPSRFAVNSNLNGGNDTITFNTLLSSTVNVTEGSGTATVTFNYCTINTLLNMVGGGFDTVHFLGCSITKKTLTNFIVF